MLLLFILAVIGLVWLIWQIDRKNEPGHRFQRGYQSRPHSTEESLNGAPKARPWQSGTAPTTEHDFFKAAKHGPFDALSYLRDGDIDGARLALHKISYIVHKDRPDLKDEFTRLMTMFVQIDPIYQTGLQRAITVLIERPGLRQTQLYRAMNMDPETARYVLYFAEAKRDIVRVKSGNSYAVFLPGQPIEFAAPKPRKRSTRKKDDQ